MKTMFRSSPKDCLSRRRIVTLRLQYGGDIDLISMDEYNEIKNLLLGKEKRGIGFNQ